MEPLLVFVSTAIGTIVGVVCAVFMMNRRGRAAATAEDAKKTLQAGAVMAAPSLNIEDLRKLLAERDQTLHQSRDDLGKIQQQLDAATAEMQKSAAAGAAAEQRAAELAKQLADISDQAKAMEARSKQDQLVAEEANGHVGALEAQLATEKRQVAEYTEIIAALTKDLEEARRTGTESDGYRSSLEIELGTGRDQILQLTTQLEEVTRERDLFSAQAASLSERVREVEARASEDRVTAEESGASLSTLEAQLGFEQQQNREFAEQITRLTAELTEARHSGAEVTVHRAALETDLENMRERMAQLITQVEELTKEKANFEVRLREERQSAARGIELLTLAQSTLSGAFKKMAAEAAMAQNGHPQPSVALEMKTTPAAESAAVPQEMEQLVAAPSEEAAEAAAEAVSA